MSPDPLAVHVPGRADPNLYAYVTGRALKYVDAVGFDTTDALKRARAFQRDIIKERLKTRAEGRRMATKVAQISRKTPHYTQREFEKANLARNPVGT